MTTSPHPVSARPHPVALPTNAVAPIILAVFLGYVAVSAPLGALALEIHDRLRFSPLAVGCLIGLQSLATLLTRH